MECYSLLYQRQLKAKPSLELREKSIIFWTGFRLLKEKGNQEERDRLKRDIVSNACAVRTSQIYYQQKVCSVIKQYHNSNLLIVFSSAMQSNNVNSFG